MQSEKRDFPFLGAGCLIAMTLVVLAFSTLSVCAQDTRWKQESERLFSTGVSAEKQNNLIEAQICYEQCQEIAQKNRLPKMEAAALHRLAIIRARNKKFSESADMFRRATTLDPKNAMILCDYAQLYADRKDYDEAERLLKTAINLEPNNPKILVNLGIIIASQKSERQAEGLRYLKLAVGEAEAYRELAKIYRSKGEVSQAEFAEQRAKLADTQQLTSPALASDGIAIRPPQHSAHQPQTPPAVVNRIRQELADMETRDIIAEANRQTAAPPVVQRPFIPAPVGANLEKMTGIPTETAANGPPPFDPFSSARPAGQSNGALRQITPTSAQTSANRIEPLLVIQPSSKSKALDTITFVQGTDDKSTVNKTSEPQLIKIPSSTKPEGNIHQRLPVSEELNLQIHLPPIRVLPNGEKRVGQSDGTNPLRQIPPGGAGLIGPGADTPMMASLPAYSAVGIKKLTDSEKQNDRQEHAGNVVISSRDVPKPQPVALEQPRNIAIALESVRTAENDVISNVPGPAQDVDVLQSPSVALARRDSWNSGTNLPIPAVEKKSYSATSLTSASPRPATPKQEPQPEAKLAYTKVAPSGQKFASTAAPAVLQFGAVRNEPPPEIQPVEPVEVASAPLKIDASPSTTHSEARPLLIVKRSSGEPLGTAVVPADSLPMVANEETSTIEPQPLAPALVAMTPLNPLLDPFGPLTVAEEQPVELPTPLPVLAATTPEPFPMLDDPFGLPRFIEPQPPAPTLVAVTTAEPLPMLDDPYERSLFSEVKKIEPLTPVPAPTVVTPSSPFIAANEKPAEMKFAEVQKIEPQTPLPVLAAVAQPNPFLMADEKSAVPKFAEMQKIEPLPPAPALAAAPPNPLPMVNEKSVLPEYAEVKKPEPQAPIPALTAIAQPKPFLATLERSKPPEFASMQKLEPLPNVVPSPAETPRAVVQELPKANVLNSPLPKLAEVKTPEQKMSESPQLAVIKPLPTQQSAPMQEAATKPLPISDEPAGFASSRKAVSKVASEDQPVGFARSRR